MRQNLSKVLAMGMLLTFLMGFFFVPVALSTPVDLLPFENLTADIGRGFGDNMNRYSWSMKEFNGHVYVGTWNVQFDWPKLVGLIQSGNIGDIIGGGNPLEGISLLQSNGGEIWRNDGGQNWTKVYKASPDDSGFRIMTEYKGKLYTGTQNNNGANILYSHNGASWNELTGGPLGNKDNISIRTMTTHNGQLYVGTENNKTGGELWSYNGANGTWKLQGKFAGDPSVAELAVHNNKLYIGTWDFSDSYKLYKKTGDSFKDVTPVFSGSDQLNNLGVMKLMDFKGQLYLGTVNYRDGFTLLRTSSPNDPNGWEVITTNGLGDKSNAYSWSMKEFNGELYLGTFNDGLYGGKFSPLPIPLDGRAQLWSSADGKNWKMLEGDGFGAPFNYGYRTMEVSDGRLFVGTASNFFIYDPSELQYLFANSFGGNIDWSTWGAQLASLGLGNSNWIGTQVWASHSVPEPATILFLGFGLMGLVGIRRKIKK